MKKLIAVLVLVFVSGCLNTRNRNPIRDEVAPVRSDVAPVQTLRFYY